MVDKLISSILLVEESSSTNSYFTNPNLPKEEQLSELPNVIIIQ